MSCVVCRVDIMVGMVPPSMNPSLTLDLTSVMVNTLAHKWYRGVMKNN